MFRLYLVAGTACNNHEILDEVCKHLYLSLSNPVHFYVIIKKFASIS